MKLPTTLPNAATTEKSESQIPEQDALRNRIYQKKQ